MVQRDISETKIIKRIKNIIKQNARTIRLRLLIPFMLILLLQTVLLSVLVLRGSVSSSLQSNAIDIFLKNTENSALNLEREMVHHWMNDINNSDTIRNSIEEILSAQGKTADDIRTDSRLNREIIFGIMPQILDLLHRSYGNGIYVILDGPASAEGKDRERAGVYISDLDSSSYAADNSDLLLFRGLPSISREYGIPLESYWELGFELEEQDPSADYFYLPFRSTEQILIDAKDAGNYAYLGRYSPQNSQQERGISYSMPLVLSDGTTIGVIGGDMLEVSVRKILDMNVLTGSVNNMRMLARRQRGSHVLEPVITHGSVFSRFFGTQEMLDYQETSWNGIASIRDRSGDSWYLAMVPLDVYNHNTPFEQEEWVVVQLQQERVLMHFYQDISRTLLLFMFLSLLFGVLAMLFAGQLIVGPIQRLIGELRTDWIQKRIQLHRTRINEVDELIDAIEALSSDVAESASQISRILEASGIPIGVFEYIKDKNCIFCSRALAELLMLDWDGDAYEYMEVEAFRTMMLVLHDPVTDGEDYIYNLAEPQGRRRYIRVKLVRVDNGNVTGVLSDVTASVEERRKLERERNYDPLTGVYNRRAFREMTEEMLQDEKLEAAALVMWDLDNLKYVNDTYGHETGDRYIRLFADHLRTLEPEGAVVERHSGDEFMAFMYHGTEEMIWRRINRFMNQMKEITLTVDRGYRIPLRASAGVVWYPRQAKNLDRMIRYADFAMYMAKHSIKGIVKEFELQSYSENSYLLSGNEELNRLLESRTASFSVQPIVARDGSIYGYEALMRPQLKNFKNIQEVLTLAKNQAKLPQFEELTWFSAMAWIESRLEQFPGQCRFFINSIASTRLTDQRIKELETQYGYLLPRTVLEVTETEQSDAEYTKTKCGILHKWNGKVALDDYGSGYSNEGILLLVQPDLVKLDLELVRNIDKDENRQGLARNMLQYCHERGILVVAEGVERLEELQMLMELGADLFQGFYLGRPEPEVRPLNPYVIAKMQELSEK